ncbi:hypothetical protein [Parafilimonas terrae]|uniref:Uncharacterized protein n=1 Tax=Parafilimonas terrae TaxID=1465490 RepID=A0A1I5XFC6_9BACT|nr:hypothetical protein [Parafilimonas terrae]SFQ30660.1 hypothetical protein SAMN05444277_108144 [Parafilimonas terrae]
MGEGYALEWLDNLITVTLNPVNPKHVIASPEDIAKLERLVIEEKNKVEEAIKTQVFNLDDDVKIKSSINKYHSSLVNLLEHAFENRSRISKHKPLKQVFNTTIACMDELLALIERRFNRYLSKDEQVPFTYLIAQKKALAGRLEVLASEPYLSSQPAFGIVKNELEKFLSYADVEHTYTFKELLYIKDLCIDLKKVKTVHEPAIYTPLDELLIRLNFNSRPYIHILCKQLADLLNNIEKPEEKMSNLLLYFKAFRQVNRKPGAVFNACDASLHTQVATWLKQEISYTRKQIQYSGSLLKEAVNSDKRNMKHKIAEKLLVKLSVDQIALVLRAADEIKIIVARSLNSVFKSIVPHLSTPGHEDISYDSMRSKSYAAELRDKELVIQTLQQIIKKIREY